MKSQLFIRLLALWPLIGLAFIVTAGTPDAADFDATTNAVGWIDGGFETPVNQLVTPAGTQVELPGIRPNALALSPDAKLLVTAGLTHELVVMEPATGKILQRVPFPADKATVEKPIVEGILNPDHAPMLNMAWLLPADAAS